MRNVTRRDENDPSRVFPVKAVLGVGREGNNSPSRVEDSEFIETSGQPAELPVDSNSVARTIHLYGPVKGMELFSTCETSLD
jgi:hypothetical protein